jgi:FtsH-binding integral membrane protein
MENYSYYNNAYNAPTAAQVENEMALTNYVNAVMRRVYGKMALGLLVTALVSWMVASSETMMMFIFENTWLFWGLMIGELALVFAISAGLQKFSSATSTALFYLYSAINGITLTPLILAYTQESVALTFLITAAVFGTMTIFGYVTKQDLSKMGTFLVMALIALIVVSVINIFVHSTAMGWLISCAGVLIFIGLTAWDTQKIKRMVAESDSVMVGKIATWGALSLYLDFINLFIYLLRIFGGGRD